MACIMQDKPKKSPRPHGRPVKEIDWDKVDGFLEIGATGVQIASYFNMHPETFYARVEEKHGVLFTAYAGSVAPKGELQLLAAQHNQAYKGNTQLLVMLGQERLGQGKKKDESPNVPPQDIIVDKDNENMALKAQLAKLQAQIDNLTKAGSQLPGVDPQV